MIRLVDRYNNYILDSNEEPLEFKRTNEMLMYVRTIMSNIHDEFDLIERGIYIEED